MDSDEIRLLLQRINETWIWDKPERFPAILGECFHEGMVIKGPEFQTMSTGREACIQSYVDFVRQAAVSACTLSTPDVDVWGDTAVATYAWKVTYERNGEQCQDSGHDVFAFVRSGGRWLAVWRAVLLAKSVTGDDVEEPEFPMSDTSR
jgi:hypothetical protein